MNVKNVVKVMNFHALLRVDKARRTAEKYMMMEQQLQSMIDHITNNRNFILDKTRLFADETKPILNIYIGSDFGFCGGFNSQSNDYLKKDQQSQKILIGNKLRRNMSNVLLHVTREEFDEDYSPIEEIINEGVRNSSYSQVNVIYNKYVNSTNIHWMSKRLFPFTFDTNKKEKYTEDFVCETDLDDLLVKLVSAYINYELKITVMNSFASENVMRQNSTSESLKKIEEREAEETRVKRKEDNENQFRKIIDNYSKMNLS